MLHSAHTLGHHGCFHMHRHRLYVRCEKGELAKTRISVVKMPLIGLEAVSNIKWVRPITAMHHAVMIHKEADEEVWIFDTIPKNAKDPATLGKMVFLRPVPATNRCKRLRKALIVGLQVPPLNTYLVSQNIEQVVEKAMEFQRAWDPWIQLNFRDCRDHSWGLAAYLDNERTDK